MLLLQSVKFLAYVGDQRFVIFCQYSLGRSGNLAVQDFNSCRQVVSLSFTTT
jgi:hypothetical protein